MKKDNDLIHIDHLFKEKLNNVVETPTSDASWAKMKALLDQDEQKKPIPIWWRFSSPNAILGTAMLIGALALGGYHMNNNQSGKSKGLSNNNNIKEIEAPNNNPSPLPITEENGTLADQREEHAPKSQENDQASSNGISTTKTEAPIVAKKEMQQSNQQHHEADSKLNFKNNFNQAKSTKTISVVGQNQVNTPANQSNETIVQRSTNDINQGNQVTKQDNLTIQDKLSAIKADDQKAIEFSASSNVDQSNQAVQGVNNTSELKNSGTQLQNVANSGNREQDSMSITTKVIREVGSNRNQPKQIVETIVQEQRVELEKPKSITSLVDSPINNAVKAEVNPKIFASNKTITAKKTSAAESEVAKAIVTKKEKSAVSKWLDKVGVKVDEVISDSKKDARNADFYYGFSIGGNYSFSNASGHNLFGLQVGPTGEVVFNDQWSIFAAVKYFNRGSSKGDYHDKYAIKSTTAAPDSTMGANWYYTVKSDSVDRKFNFGSAHSIELPLAVRYTLNNKLYFQGGVNFAYYLPMNVEMKETQLNTSSNVLLVTNFTTPILNNKKLLNADDFGSRFGFGYLVGAGYQISPSCQVDFKMVQQLTDNAKGRAKEISDNLFKRPSFQISLGYQINRASKKPQTFGPTDNRTRK
jgi:hypothetical protein